ncbi:membrane fusion protein, Cu(I)/Ag(I) efflux system [Bosea sp. CRIB-10]|uniref:efflux RND transporter periplasmic adaptor subunit n=1 Tax=Bosea sp. CRIB-10 TaxID=378404 RepID=UPI0008E088F3|nr:efflux RND transporter periplasmic adaptor subunit [Bosea sp. CRIB-10]SFD32042.1 membrane fusion protein, Cu(I)/Ag(I) efflux system [Bosea sp. CRIB-10]
MLLAVVIAVAAAAVGGIIAGRSDMTLPAWLPGAGASKAGLEPAGSGPIVYYRDPDGLAAFSAAPAKTVAGKDYLSVRASQDIRFDPPSAAPDQVAAAGPKRIKFYRNPMGLPDTSPTPKKDSMGMDYLPVFEGEEEEAGIVKVSAGKLQKAGVRSEPVAFTPLSLPLRAPGTIQLDERRVSVVALRFEGFVETVEDVTTGSSVRKGQPLMRVYGPALSSAAAEYVTVLNGRPDGPIPAQGVRGARRRLENLAVPDAALSAIERTREVPVAVAWPAPQDGVVLERAAVNGMRAGPGDVLFRIADISLVWARIDLAERDLGMVAPGQAVTVTPRGMRGRSFTGRVALVYPQINKETRTGRVRVELDNPDGVLKPDMYVEAQIATGDDEPVLNIADDAVIDSGARQIVLIDKGEGRFEPREVKLGRRGAGRVEIMEGVAAEDRIVVSANFLIDAESNLKAALQSLIGGETQP